MSARIEHMNERRGSGAGEARRGRLVDLTVELSRQEATLAAARCRAVAQLHVEFLAEQEQDLVETLADLRVGSSAAERRRHHAQVRRWQDEARRRADRACAASVSLALGISLPAADRMVDLALALERHPLVGAALADGRVDQSQAHAVLDGLSRLTDPEHQRQLTTRLLTELTTPQARAALVRELRHDGRTIWDLPPHKLRPIIARESAALDPRSLVDNEQRCRDERRVWFQSGGGTDLAALILTGPEAILSAAFDRLDQEARTRRRAGHPDSLDQIRFDLGTALLTSGAVSAGPDLPSAAQAGPSRWRPLVNLTMARSTLVGDDDSPATLHGPGGDVPISAGEGRRLARAPEARWRDITCDPSTGAAVAVSPRYQPLRYRPTTAAAELVRVRDGHCSRFPTSGARVVELDHVAEFDHADPAAGGPTTPDNLACAGKRDHQDKTDGLIEVLGDANDVLTYRTGTGHVYRSWPHQYLDPQPPPPQQSGPDPPP